MLGLLEGALAVGAMEGLREGRGSTDVQGWAEVLVQCLLYLGTVGRWGCFAVAVIEAFMESYLKIVEPLLLRRLGMVASDGVGDLRWWWCDWARVEKRDGRIKGWRWLRGVDERGGYCGVSEGGLGTWRVVLRSVLREKRGF